MIGKFNFISANSVLLGIIIAVVVIVFGLCICMCLVIAVVIHIFYQAHIKSKGLLLTIALVPITENYSLLCNCVGNQPSADVRNNINIGKAFRNKKLE